MSDVMMQVDLQTGAFLKPRFEEDLVQATKYARRNHTPLTVLYLDVDNVLELNDLYGRESVDAALGNLPSIISRVLNGMGPIGRMGDDEFAVSLLGVPLIRGRRMAERIRQAIARVQHFSKEGMFHLTVSIGVACLLGDEPPGNLLEAAELACFRVKQGGRDGVACR